MLASANDNIEEASLLLDLIVESDPFEVFLIEGLSLRQKRLIVLNGWKKLEDLPKGIPDDKLLLRLVEFSNEK